MDYHIRTEELRNDNVYNLKDLFDQWKLPNLMQWPSNNISSKWRCRIVPQIDDTDELQMIERCIRRDPFLTSAHRADGAFNSVKGCILKYLREKPSWNPLSKPKLGMIGGWGRPDTPTANAEALVLVEGFDDVLKSTPEKPYNLQMFHRQKLDPDNFPILPSKLNWPLKEIFETHQENFDGFKIGELCDMATRISRRGALTWWHLDDSGEFVFQAGMPVDKNHKEPDGTIPQKLWGPSGNPVVKIFIYFPRDNYNMVFFDKKTNETGMHCALDIFNTPDEELPPAECLPILNVAVLEAHSAPLLSPPNIAHVVLTTHDCVMVEQRRVSRIFADESLWFLKQSKTWVEKPIFYPLLSEVLVDPKVSGSDFIDIVIKFAQTMTDYIKSGIDLDASNIRRKHELLLERARISLTALVSKDFAEFVKIAPIVRANALKELANLRNFASSYKRSSKLALPGSTVDPLTIISPLNEGIYVQPYKDSFRVEFVNEKVQKFTYLKLGNDLSLTDEGKLSEFAFFGLQLGASKPMWCSEKKYSIDEAIIAADEMKSEADLRTRISVESAIHLGLLVHDDEMSEEEPK